MSSKPQPAESANARCESCDKAYHVPDPERTYSCKACGGTVRGTEAATRHPHLESAVTCTKCHAINHHGAHFCAECGSILGASPSVPPDPKAAEARHDAMEALKRGYRWIAGITWLFRLGALAYALVTVVAVFALASTDVPLEPGILVAALAALLTMVMLVGALLILFEPFTWTLVTALLASFVSVAHLVGPNPLGLMFLWSSAWAALFWIALVPALRFKRLASEHEDMYILHHASRRTRRSLKGRSPKERHERLLSVRQKAARRAWKVSAAAVVLVAAASVIGAYSVATKMRPQELSVAVAGFESTWNGGDLRAVGETFAPAVRSRESERLAGMGDGHGWTGSVPRIEGGRFREEKNGTWVDYDVSGLTLSTHWILDGRSWSLLEFELPQPPLEPVLERFLEAWRASDPQAIASLFPPDYQERMRASIQASAERRGWDPFPAILGTERSDLDENETEVDLLVEDGEVTTKWVFRGNGRWGLNGLKLPKAP